MNTKNKRLFIVWCLFLVPAIALNVYTARWSDVIWMLSVTIMLLVIIKLNEAIGDQIKIIRNQEREIDIITNTDAWKRMKRISAEADRCARNCYYYLKRIEELKIENEQLKTLNKNLIETKFNGKCYGNKNSNRRANQKGDK